MVKILSAPLVAHHIFSGGRRKDQERDPLILIAGHVAQGTTDLGNIPQVVKLGHQAAQKRLSGALNDIHLKFA